MRSTEEMKRAVHREAAHRRSRRRALVSGGVGALALVLLTAAVARAGTGGDSAEVSTGDAGAPPTSAPSTTAAAEPGPTTPGTMVIVDETGETVVVATGGPAASSPRSTTPRTTSASGDPLPDGGPTTSTPGSPVTAGSPPPSTGPAPTSTAPQPPPPSSTPTSEAVRPCTADDIIRAPLRVYAPTATGPGIPAGHVVQFGYSTLARTDITPCRTPDSLQVLSITDAGGTEVFRHTYDGGPGRVITPGTWVMFRGSVSWDPSCATPTPPSFVWACTPAGPGNYLAHLTDQGVVYPEQSLTISPGS